MKKLIPIFAALSLAVSCGTPLQIDSGRALSSILMAGQAASISDAQIQAYVAQYIAALDAQSTVMPASSPYTRRLMNLVSGIKQVDGVPLNFKVYKQNEINAFACADGSVRVYTGMMDAMSDDELLGVIGHEIGHVALKHTKKEMRQAILTAAALQGLSSASRTMAVITDSQLGSLGQAIIGAQYSKSQESQADDYGYDFLVSAGKNPWAMAAAFEKLQSLSGSAAYSSAVTKLFSSHPDTAKRIERMSKRAAADGYKRP